MFGVAAGPVTHRAGIGTCYVPNGGEERLAQLAITRRRERVGDEEISHTQRGCADFYSRDDCLQLGLYVARAFPWDRPTVKAGHPPTSTTLSPTPAPNHPAL